MYEMAEFYNKKAAKDSDELHIIINSSDLMIYL